MIINPTDTRILVKIIQEEPVTQGGILLPNPPEKPSRYGEVMQIGPKVSEDILVGNTVIFSKYAGQSIDENNIILKEEEVLATVKTCDTI